MGDLEHDVACVFEPMGRSPIGAARTRGAGHPGRARPAVAEGGYGGVRNAIGSNRKVFSIGVISQLPFRSASNRVSDAFPIGSLTLLDFLPFAFRSS